MVQIIPARDISLYELEEKFGLQLATDTNNTVNHIDVIKTFQQALQK